LARLDLSHESPSDVAVTMRSLPRRFGEALAARDDDDVESLAGVLGPDGASALDHVADTGRMLALIGGALGEVVSGRRPVLPAAITDPSARTWEHAATDLEGELSLLTDEAIALAELVERTSAEQWKAAATVTGGTEMTALDLAREAVQVAIADLKATEAAMAAARRA
jgi:hypothetical protein